MKSAKAPTPPDPVATAAAQTQSNKDTAGYTQALNLIDQNTPLGSLTYNNIGSDPTTGAPHYEADVSLSPTGQRSFDLQQAVGESLNNLALKGTSQVSDAFGKSLDYGSLPGLKSLDLSSLTGRGSYDLSGAPALKNYDTSGLPQMPGGLDFSGLKDLPNGLDTTGLPELAQFDTSKLGDAPVANDHTRQLAADALYGQATSRLDPQYADSQKQLETQLINKGIAQGSDAWNHALESFNRSKNDAYDSARRNSISDAVGYETGQFNLENTAYGNRRDTEQMRFTDQNSARSQGVGERQQQVATALGLRQQGVNERQQQIATALGLRQQGSNEMQQAVADALAGRQQYSTENLTAAQLADQQRQQQLAEQQASSSQDLRLRQQGVTEADYLRELPINEVSSLLHGGEVSMPNFNNTPQTNMAPTDVAGITQNSFNDQFQVYKSQMDANNALIGAVFGAAGSAAGGWAMGGWK
jgi:hypothetical protein